MRNFITIESPPGTQTHDEFINVVNHIYDASSPRFIYGHEPSETHLVSCYTIFDGPKAVGRFALYINPYLTHNGAKTATIGSYECVDDNDTATFLIDDAIGRARALGCKYLIGPMEGSTWKSYRFSVNNSFPNFFLEPYHHTYYNEHFLSNGFEVLSEYRSNLNSEMGFDEDLLLRFENDFSKKGMHIRHIRMDDVENELEKIAKFCIEAFSNNYLYTQIQPIEFVRDYQKVAHYFNPELILIIENEAQKIEALSFSVEDHLDPKKETIIIKTLARLPKSSIRGIGTYLGGKTNQLARQLGFKKAIHAFMLDSNASLRISKNKYGGMAYKNYNLYIKTL